MFTSTWLNATWLLLGLCHKIFFKGGIWPGTKKIEKAAEEDDDIGKQKLRWIGFALMASQVYKFALTDNLTTNQKTALETDAKVWTFALAMHVEPFVKKTQPKELCLQQFFTIPLLTLMCVLAAKKL